MRLRPVPMSVLHKMLTTNRVRGHCLHSRTRRKRIASSPGRSQLTAHLCTSRRLKQDSVGNDDSGWRTSRDRTTRRLSQVLQDSPAIEIGGIITGNSRVQLNDSDWLPRSPDCRCGSCARSGRRIPGHPDQIPYRRPSHRPSHRLQGLHVTINGTRFRSRRSYLDPCHPDRRRRYICANENDTNVYLRGEGCGDSCSHLPTSLPLASAVAHRDRGGFFLKSGTLNGDKVTSSKPRESA